MLHCDRLALAASGLAPDSSRAQRRRRRTPASLPAASRPAFPTASFSLFFLEARPCHFSSRPLGQNLLDILFGVRPPMHLVPRLQQYPRARGATSSPLLSQCGRLKQLSLRQPVSYTPFRLMAAFVTRHLGDYELSHGLPSGWLGAIGARSKRTLAQVLQVSPIGRFLGVGVRLDDRPPH